MSDATHTADPSSDLQGQLITELRQELEEYGGLLSLLDLQQAAVLDRKPDDVLELISRIDAQLATTNTCRKRREATAAQLASLSQIPGPRTPIPRTLEMSADSTGAYLAPNNLRRGLAHVELSQPPGKRPCS